MPPLPHRTFLIVALTIARSFAGNYGTLPLYFEPQQAGGVFVSRASQCDYLITGQKAVLGTGASLSIGGSNPKAVATGEELLPGQSTYLIGRDPAKWRTAVPQYARVRVSEVLPKVDVVYYGANGALEFDLILHPGANSSNLRMQISGAGKRRLTQTGDLEIETERGTFTQRKPQISQGGHAIAGRYILERSGDVRIALGAYDHTHDLTIDPVIVYSTFLGGAVYDSPNAIAANAAGNTYIAGSTASFNFPVTAGAVRTIFPSTPAMVAFVAKVNPAGTGLIYATYLGGSGLNGGDAANGIAVDSAGNAYVTGTTGSTDFPVTAGAFSTTLNGPVDAFVTKLNATGTALAYSTYFGGSGMESATAIAIDGSGNAFITGATGSTDLPVTPGVIQSTLQSANDAFLAKVSPTGHSLVYCTYLGGSAEDDANALTLDTAGNAYVAGTTASADFPVTQGSYQTALTGSTAAFVAKVNPSGTGLLYATFLGGSGGDYANAIAVDSSGDTYVAGTTYSGDFPTTVGTYATVVPGAVSLGHGFVSKLSPTGGTLLYSTFLGGSNADAIGGIALDSSGNAAVAGFTYSANFPVTPNPLDPLTRYSPAGFVSKFNTTATSLTYSTLLGASGSTAVQALASDTANHIFVTGLHVVPKLPHNTRSFSPVNGAISGQTGTGFVAKFDLGSATVCSLSVSPANPTVAVGGGNIYASVTAPAGCAWEASSAAAWLSVASTPHGIGSGSIVVAALPNGGSLAGRSGQVSVGGASLSVSQAAGTCSAPQLFPGTQAFGPAGGTGSVAVVLPSACSFAASSGSGWISITSALTGIGDTLLEFAVSPDTGVSRTGTLTIAGSQYTISQITSACGFSVNFPSGSVALSGGSLLFANVIAGSNCVGTASSSVAWLMVSAPSFTGSGPIFFQALANTTGSARSATVTIAGQPYIFSQGPNGS